MQPYRRHQSGRTTRAAKRSLGLTAKRKKTISHPSATVTPMVKLDMGENIGFSVALPCYRADKIAWLALESLCRQKDIDFEWELIICEEEHEEMVGDWFLNQYIQRLMDVGCKRIVYLHLDQWVLLAKKWQIMGKHISKTSGAFMLQAADCYSGKNRLRKSYDKVVKEGVEWHDYKKGYFYSFISDRVILYDCHGTTNLNMCMAAKYARSIPDTHLERGVDSFLLKHCLSQNPNLEVFHEDELQENSLDTHGMNIISTYRERFFDIRADIFKKTKKQLKSIITDPALHKRMVELQKSAIKIKQIRVSQSVKFFSDKIKAKYNLTEYKNIYSPVFFMGLYGPADYHALSNHKGVCVVIWCGSDAMVAHKYIDKYDIKRSNIYHVATGEFIANDLKELGVSFIQLPVTPSDSNITPRPVGDSVYMYSSRSNPKFYGEHLVEEIKKRINLDVIVAYKDSYSYDELMEVYEKSFIGLRLTIHDGLPNTVLELGLMGRKCIYNGGLPHSIPWEGVDDICENILNEYNNRHVDNTQSIHKDMKEFLDCGDEWLYLDYYVKKIKKPRVSVIMNSYNEDPEYFREAVLSYLDQVDVEVELIVSTVENDPCVEILQEYPVKVVVSQTPSIYGQLNKGIEACNGDWVVYASSNDVAFPDKLIKEVEACVYRNKKVCYSNFHKCDEDLNVVSTTNFHEYDYQKHTKDNFVSDCSLFSVELLKKYLPFREEYGNSAYHDFWLRVFEGEGDVFTYNEVPTWKYRITSNSRHIRKQRDKELMEVEANEKSRMLLSRKRISQNGHK